MDEKQPVVIQGHSIERVRRTLSPRTMPYSRARVSRTAYLNRSAPAQRTTLVPRTGSSLRYRTYKRTSEDSVQTVVLIRKMMTAIAVGLLVFIMSIIPWSFTQKLVGHVRTAVTHDLNWDDTIGQLKFVGRQLPDIQAVFGTKNLEPEPPKDGSSLVFTSPARGQIIRLFMEKTAGEGSDNQGIDISVHPESSFYAATGGLVAAIVEHEIFGTSLWLSHGDNTFTFYGGCADVIVELGQKVSEGEKLGTIAVQSSGMSVLHFQVWVNETPMDPLGFLPVHQPVNNAGDG